MTCEAKKPAHLFNSSTVVILRRQFLDQVQEEHNLVIVVRIYLWNRKSNAIRVEWFSRQPVKPGIQDVARRTY